MKPQYLLVSACILILSGCGTVQLPSNLSKNKVGCTIGNCVNGYGVYNTYKDHRYYNKVGKRNMTSAFIHTKYEGNFKNKKKHGKGKLTYYKLGTFPKDMTRDKEFEGVWENGNKKGNFIVASFDFYDEQTSKKNHIYKKYSNLANAKNNGGTISVGEGLLILGAIGLAKGISSLSKSNSKAPDSYSSTTNTPEPPSNSRKNTKPQKSINSKSKKLADKGIVVDVIPHPAKHIRADVICKTRSGKIRKLRVGYASEKRNTCSLPGSFGSYNCDYSLKRTKEKCSVYIN